MVSGAFDGDAFVWVWYVSEPPRLMQIQFRAYPNSSETGVLTRLSASASSSKYPGVLWSNEYLVPPLPMSAFASLDRLEGFRIELSDQLKDAWSNVKEKAGRLKDIAVDQEQTLKDLRARNIDILGHRSGS